MVPAASVIKTAILGAVAEAVPAGSGVLRHFRPPVTLSLYDVALLMIIVSDNAATNRCIDLVGMDAVNRFCRAQGLARTGLHRPPDQTQVAAARIASTRLLGLARPVPARSNAVPWSTDVRRKGKPSVRLTVPYKSKALAAMCPWS